ncbi:hypothetical protein NDU88_002271 [Pleurodeles waltl]|uniref:Uncharacterized protein n=1 Tax=Pleurodeles waltl TaxID=8319 RepID=A0AAV7KRN5_PLEWA|nr:hypothetical protein NDU88_002271 [Pleurodeles waltl]
MTRLSGPPYVKKGKTSRRRLLVYLDKSRPRSELVKAVEHRNATQVTEKQPSTMPLTLWRASVPLDQRSEKNRTVAQRELSSARTDFGAKIKEFRSGVDLVGRRLRNATTGVWRRQLVHEESRAFSSSRECLAGPWQAAGYEARAVAHRCGLSPLRPEICRDLTGPARAAGTTGDPQRPACFLGAGPKKAEEEESGKARRRI